MALRLASHRGKIGCNRPLRFHQGDMLVTETGYRTSGCDMRTGTRNHCSIFRQQELPIPTLAKHI